MDLDDVQDPSLAPSNPTLTLVLTEIDPSKTPPSISRCLELARACDASLRQLSALVDEHRAELPADKLPHITSVTTSARASIADVCRAFDKCGSPSNIRSWGRLRWKLQNAAGFEALTPILERHERAVADEMAKVVAIAELKPVSTARMLQVQEEENRRRSGSGATDHKEFLTDYGVVRAELWAPFPGDPRSPVELPGSEPVMLGRRAELPTPPAQDGNSRFIGGMEPKSRADLGLSGRERSQSAQSSPSAMPLPLFAKFRKSPPPLAHQESQASLFSTATEPPPRSSRSSPFGSAPSPPPQTSRMSAPLPTTAYLPPLLPSSSYLAPIASQSTLSLASTVTASDHRRSRWGAGGTRRAMQTAQNDSSIDEAGLIALFVGDGRPPPPSIPPKVGFP